MGDTTLGCSQEQGPSARRPGPGCRLSGTRPGTLRAPVDNPFVSSTACCIYRWGLRGGVPWQGSPFFLKPALMPARRTEKGQCWKRQSVRFRRGQECRGFQERRKHIPSLGRKKAEVSVDAGAPQHVNFASTLAAGREVPLDEPETGGTRACLRSRALKAILS